MCIRDRQGPSEEDPDRESGSLGGKVEEIEPRDRAGEDGFVDLARRMREREESGSRDAAHDQRDESERRLAAQVVGPA